MAVLGSEAATHGEARAERRAHPRDWTAVLYSRWMLAVALLAGFAAYAPTINDFFVADDFWFLRASQSTPFWEHVLRMFDPRETSIDGELNRYRPLYPLMWRLQFELFGLEAAYYRLVLIGLHLGCTVLAWLTFRRLFPRHDDAWIPNVAALIFAIHPGYANAVAWLSGGNRVFAVFPYLLALLLYMKSRDAGSRATAWYVLSLLAYGSAMLMHSASITLVAVIALHRFCIEGEPRDALRWRSWFHLAPFVALAAGEAVIQWYERQHIGLEGGFKAGFHQYENYGWYFGMQLVPVETLTSADSIQRVLERLRLVASVLLILVSATMAYRRPFFPIAVLAVGAFVAMLLPDSTFLVGDQSRILYMSAWAGALLLVTGGVFVTRMLVPEARRAVVRLAPYALIVAVPIVVAATYSRTTGVSDHAATYERLASAVSQEGPTLPEGGTLFVSGAPSFFILPDSVLVSLVQLYYGDVPVVIVHAGDPPPVLGPDDRLFAHTP